MATLPLLPFFLDSIHHTDRRVTLYNLHTTTYSLRLHKQSLVCYYWYHVVKGAVCGAVLSMWCAVSVLSFVLWSTSKTKKAAHHCVYWSTMHTQSCTEMHGKNVLWLRCYVVNLRSPDPIWLRYKVKTSVGLCRLKLREGSLWFCSRDELGVICTMCANALALG